MHLALHVQVHGGGIYIYCIYTLRLMVYVAAWVVDEKVNLECNHSSESDDWDSN